MSAIEIRALRKRLGLTAKEFGDLVGVTENTVYRWEIDWRRPHKQAIMLLRQLEKQGVNQVQ